MSGEQQPRHLHIKLVRGRGLAAKDIGGTSDPYVKIVHRTASGDVSEWKSKVVDKTLDPVWNEELEITLPEDRSGFYLQCYDKNKILKDEKIGECGVKVDDLEYGVETERTVIIEKEAFFELKFYKSGEIDLILKAINFGKK